MTRRSSLVVDTSQIERVPSRAALTAYPPVGARAIAVLAISPGTKAVTGSLTMAGGATGAGAGSGAIRGPGFSGATATSGTGAGGGEGFNAVRRLFASGANCPDGYFCR